MKLKIKIETGNDAVKTKEDVANLLYDLAINFLRKTEDKIEGSIFDDNGNRVGVWKFSED